jgi:protein-S-isoprenylcysteine O-methyltransferase Ste14
MTVLTAWLLYGFLAFGLRTLVQVVATGKTGWVSLRRIKQPLERTAWWAISIALCAACASALLPPMATSAWLRWLGWLLYASGLILTVAAQVAMGRSWRVGQDSEERTQLVAYGLFGLVRNPIYTGMLLTVLALTLVHCNWLAIAAYALLMLGLELQVRRVEEPFLAGVHGAAYQRYAAHVGRFVPGVGVGTRLPDA